MASPSTHASQSAALVITRPTLTREQEDLILRAAGRRVAAAVCRQPSQRMVAELATIAQIPVFGSFVSLKRSGQLRSCCGFLGQAVPLAEALDHAAVRAACDDPRFPPISPAELDYLDMEVWLLWGMEPVKEQGKNRVRAVTVGTHGLQIARGQARGLLLPSVAIEHHLDATGFLRQVCLKAGLPPDAWLEDDTVLSTFEGYAIHGKLKTAAGTSAQAAVSPGGPSPEELLALAQFCRGNLVAVVYGATPSYYFPGGFDAGINGVVVTVHVPGQQGTIESSKVSLRPQMPLQATLFELVQGAAQALAQSGINAEALSQLSCGLSVFWDPAMHGTARQPELEGIDPRRRLILVAEAGRWALAFNPDQTASALFSEVADRAKACGSPSAQVCSMAVATTEPRLAASNIPRPQPGPEVRPPAVAGRFYPGTPEEIDRMLGEMLPFEPKPEPWAAVMVPHAGWMYSGRLAAAGLARVCIPSRTIVICPKHRPGGADWAVAPHRVWALPGRNVESDPDLAQRLADSITDLAADAEAHRAEHAIEVQLPILARLAPNTRVVGIAMLGGDLARLQRFAEQLAGVLRDMPECPLLVISTDMNHYATDAHTRKVDRMALDAIESLDPERLYQTVMENKISMCGVLPAVVVMETLRRLGALNRCQPVGYATSGGTTGDLNQVVGYAAMLLS